MDTLFKWIKPTNIECRHNILYSLQLTILQRQSTNKNCLKKKQIVFNFDIIGLGALINKSLFTPFS